MRANKNNDNQGSKSLEKKLKAFYKQWDTMSAEDKSEMLEAIKKQLLFATQLLENTAPGSFNEKDRTEIATRTMEVKTRLADLNRALSSRRNSYFTRLPKSSYN